MLLKSALFNLEHVDRADRATVQNALQGSVYAVEMTRYVEKAHVIGTDIADIGNLP